MSVTDYYDLEQRKLLLASEEVGMFTKHAPSIGSFRERCLRDYLRKHIHNRFSLTGGFVVDHDETGTNIVDRYSRQVDCLVFDDVDFAPLLRAHDFSCVAPRAVVAAIEVKSALTLYRQFHRTSDVVEEFPFCLKGKRYRWAGTVIDAVENIRSVNHLFHDPSHPTSLTHFGGIFGYQCSGIQNINDPLVWTQIISQLGLEHLNELPDSICVLETGWWNFSAYDLSFGDCEFAPDTIYLNHIPSTAGQIGVPLQDFTATLTHTCTRWIAKEPHRVGGLRSGVGAAQGKVSERLTLSAVGYGGEPQ